MNGTTRRILYAGTYERDYPRNVVTIRALRRAGFRVDEIHEPVWERNRDKSGSFLRLSSLLRVAGRLAAAYGKLVRALWSALSAADVVVVGYIGQADMLLLAPLARLRRRPVIFNPLVTLTDTLVEDRKLVAPTGLPARLIAAVDRLALRLADVVVVDTPENSAYLIERFRVPADRVHQVDVGADEQLFRPCPASTVALPGRDIERGSGSPGLTVQDRGKAAQLAGTLHVLFYGKLIPLHGIETILQAADRLRHERSVHFEIIGSGQLSAEMHALARRLELANVEFIPWVPFDQLPARIAAADVVLGIFGDTAKAARVVPNKVFQAMAMGAAIITRESPAIRRLLVDEESALLVPPGDPAALAAAILRLQEPALRSSLGRGAHLAFTGMASLDALAQLWSRVVHSAVASSRAARTGWGGD